MIKFYTRKIGLLAVFLLLVTSVSAQLKITGIVKSSDDGQTLPGVSVKVKNVSTTVSTDDKGRSSINQNINKGQVVTLILKIISPVKTSVLRELKP